MKTTRKSECTKPKARQNTSRHCKKTRQMERVDSTGGAKASKKEKNTRAQGALGRAKHR